MRKLNMFLVQGILVTFLIHAIMGGLQLAGASADAHKTVARICAGLIVAHMLVTVVLTYRTLHARRISGAGYFRQNLTFWIRRISGLAILPPLIAHLLIFRASQGGAYRLQVFDRGRMISQILLVAAMALHVLTNIRPLLISMGVKDTRSFATDLLLILSALFLLFGLAFVIYFLRWAAY